MFMVRAVFWITVVAVLLPRMPDLGLGGTTGVSLWSGPPAAASTMSAARDCGKYEDACRTGIYTIDQFQAAALIALARVKAEIEEQKRQRDHA